MSWHTFLQYFLLLLIVCLTRNRHLLRICRWLVCLFAKAWLASLAKVRLAIGTFTFTVVFVSILPNTDDGCNSASPIVCYWNFPLSLTFSCDNFYIFSFLCEWLWDQWRAIKVRVKQTIGQIQPVGPLIKWSSSSKKGWFIQAKKECIC